jgi:type II secretion system protein N
MNRQRLYWVACIVTGVLMLPFLALQLIPDQAIEQAAVRLLASHGITMQARQFTVGFPASVSTSDLTLGTTTDTLFKADQLRVRPRFFPLLLGRLSLVLDGRIGATGRLEGHVQVAPRIKGQVLVNQLQLGDLPALTSAFGNGVSGAARIDLTLSESSRNDLGGEIKLQIRNLRLQQVRLASLPLPDVTFPEVRGMATLQGQTITVNNLALQGTDLYARISGTVNLAPQAPLQLQLELMPEAELLASQQSVFLLMLPFQQAPGSYRLPIVGTLQNPQLAIR